MKTIVMKFGGSSLGEPEKIRIMADRAITAAKKGFAVAMVVSAPADITDDLLTLAKLLSPKLPPREHDALLAAGEQISAAIIAMTIIAKGKKAISLTGAQAGIKTDAVYANAGVTAVNPDRIIKELKKGAIAVIAGFQGTAPNGDTTTLGRGGSDFTAVALARALRAVSCELYTDVKGIYNANPALVPDAKLIKKMSYQAVLDMARTGTEVRQLRAIEYAAKYKIPLRLRSSFENSEGTLIT